jgi:hypothetical protein
MLMICVLFLNKMNRTCLLFLFSNKSETGNGLCFCYSIKMTKMFRFWLFNNNETGNGLLFRYSIKMNVSSVLFLLLCENEIEQNERNRKIPEGSIKLSNLKEEIY